MSGCMNISQLTIAVIMFLPDLVIDWISGCHLRASISIHLNMNSIFIQIYNFSLSSKDRLFKIYLSLGGEGKEKIGMFSECMLSRMLNVTIQK